ncbi:flagellar hook assembly protein FlgD [Clostridium botulinum]|uniref:flagellar hook assembly protein FlgD n=1 Tax=Clostridium botulinum TaxID=1491 RepID=UPI0004D6F84F|nr:flagellar hook capping FlgD N-terminal domain-containing protein [Clostridium botulinum]KEI02080.1 flagellar hook capping protein FlgD [Clostridium botulinum C/D str. BKT75002]KEI09496.1 flagellar hook capping protein FlgD [Clostridium botulinum C/D str. BKT2873]QPW59595.1 flagellar biosynthesis protein FlgD [Clostridium botulinum]
MPDITTPVYKSYGSQINNNDSVSKLLKNNKSSDKKNALEGKVEKVNHYNKATNRGTKIVKKGQEMDKNAFLKILTAELTNQDPMNAKDSTQYISQLAQFSGLEQMANLNSTMSFNSAGSMVGKTVALSSYDDYGRQYGGTVTNVRKDGDDIILNVNVAKYKGNELIGREDKEFNYKDVSDVLSVPDEKDHMISYLIDHMNYLNDNLSFMGASSLIGKQVEVSTKTGQGKDEKEVISKGSVLETFRTKDGIKLKVKLSDTGEEKEFLYSQVMKIRK